MAIERELANRTLELHPARAAAVLERLPAEETQRLLEALPARRGATVLRRLASTATTAVLARLSPERAGDLLAALEPGEAALLLRRLDEPLRDSILAAMPEAPARSIGSLLRFPESSAGGLADPDALALPEDLTAAEALEAVRGSAANARYNLYVVDRAQRLVGVLNLRELLMTPGETRLGDAMQPSPHRLHADADLATVIHHPGWLKVHALPVVDERGVYVGVIRYKTLRALERRDATRTGEVEAAHALGELFATAAGGLLDALVGPPGQVTEGRDHG
jgi:magnesium transporter